MNSRDFTAPPTVADGMLALAKVIGSTDGKLIMCPDIGPTGIARFALAKRFHDRGPAFAFRALVEGWDLDRIIKELY